MTDRWEEKRKWVEEKIEQAEKAEAALKEGKTEFLGLPPREVLLLSLRIAVSDCADALADRELPAPRKRWFHDTKLYCEALIEEGYGP